MQPEMPGDFQPIPQESLAVPTARTGGSGVCLSSLGTGGPVVGRPWEKLAQGRAGSTVLDPRAEAKNRMRG